MRIYSDGRFRCVIAFEDPGMPNWLDPMQLPQGQCMFRWYDGEPFDLPQTRVVKLTELAQYLAADTPRVSSEQRKAALRQRARDSLRRWGY